MKTIEFKWQTERFGGAQAKTSKSYARLKSNEKVRGVVEKGVNIIVICNNELVSRCLL